MMHARSRKCFASVPLCSLQTLHRLTPATYGVQMEQSDTSCQRSAPAFSVNGFLNWASICEGTCLSLREIGRLLRKP